MLWSRRLDERNIRHVEHVLRGNVIRRIGRLFLSPINQRAYVYEKHILQLNVKTTKRSLTTKTAGDQIRIQPIPDDLQKSAVTSQWFTKEIKIPPQARVLLEQYSGYAPGEIIPHVSGLVSTNAHLALSCLSLWLHGDQIAKTLRC